jgi:hypothetical protein
MVCDLLQKIELFHTAGTQMVPPHGPDVVKAFYDILTVLDSKGLALLAFDGIIVAATTFAAEKGGVFHRRGTARWLAIDLRRRENFIAPLLPSTTPACLRRERFPQAADSLAD